MKNTYVISALMLGLAFGLLSSSNTYAQEYISTQSTELAQAIERAEAAKTAAGEIKTDRAAQIAHYLDNVINDAENKAKNSNASSDDIIKYVNDATASANLLLGKKPTQKTTSEATPVVKSEANTSAQKSEVAARTQVANLSEPAEVAVAMPEGTVATPAVEAPAKPAQATGTTISLEIKPEAEIAIADPEESKVVLATAQIDTDNTTVDDATTPETVEVPATGETKNNLVGKIIAIAVAAVVAMGGAILIVKRIKKNA